MVEAIAAYAPDNARSQLIVKGSNRIILDAYNANPSSMQAAIDNFEKQDANKKMLCLGAMMELGATSIEEHQVIIDMLQEKGFNNVLLVGGDFAKVNHPYKFFNESEESTLWLKDQHLTDTLVLIKGSRSTKMEKLLDAL
jgi:UDP-N-acetylmuramoyl-tripeptide--D-alanyl-D-alanine ligase